METQALTIKNLFGKDEVVRDIPGFEGRYLIGNSGKVVSIKYYGKCDYPKDITPRKTGKGYLRVHLGSKDFYIHRLVAYVFVQNPDPNNLREVNHKDFDKSNNHADNLEWCNHSANMKHAHENGRVVFSNEVR
jgi:hypothetical protein